MEAALEQEMTGTPALTVPGNLHCFFFCFSFLPTVPHALLWQSPDHTGCNCLIMCLSLLLDYEVPGRSVAQGQEVGTRVHVHVSVPRDCT